MIPDKKSSRHPQQGVVRRVVERPAPEDVRAFLGIPAAFVLDYLGKHGALPNEILPLSSGMTVCGPAVTCFGADVNVRRMAIDLAQPGDVVVVAAGGRAERASFGEYTARQMDARGISGMIVDGAVRDARDLRELGYPTFARGVTPRNFAYPIAELGSVNVPVSVGEVVVFPGDLVVGDDDGVVVVPSGEVAQMAGYIRRAFEADTDKRRGDLTRPFGLEGAMKAAGYVFVDGED